MSSNEIATDIRQARTGRIIKTGVCTHVQGVGRVADATLIEWTAVDGTHRLFCRPGDLVKVG
jgi:hypothetical protein